MATKKRYGFVIDLLRCIDCRACMVACSVENKVPMNHTRIWVHDLGIQGEFPTLSHTFIPWNCMHCQHPPCTEVCVSGATYKNEENGLVLVDQDACIGCGYCVDACPYNVRYLDEKRGVVDKCNGCLQRVEIGKMPACVATCLGGARLFGDFNDPESTVSRALKDARIIHRVDYENKGQDTDPNIFFINGNIGETIQIVHPVMMNESSLLRDPKYTLAEEGWKKVFVPAIVAGIGASFMVQAVYFSKQLIEGEKEFDE